LIELFPSGFRFRRFGGTIDHEREVLSGLGQQVASLLRMS
jgi:hypothetical protein